jgi:putative ABC transport system permease protein
MMTRLALATLRFRVAASVATLVAVLLGTALLAACGGMSETALRLDTAPQRFAGQPIVVSGSSGFTLPDQENQRAAYAETRPMDTDVVARVAAVPGVGAAVTNLSFPAVPVIGGRPNADGLPLAGHDWASAALTPYALRAGTEPRERGQVVLDALSANRIGVGPGDRITIAVAGEARQFMVSGIAEPTGHVDAPAYFFAGADVPPGAKVDAIGVRPAPGEGVRAVADRIAEEFPELTVYTGGDRGLAEFADVGASRLPLMLLAAVFGSMALLVMPLVVAATISLSVRQRERELALLRASGATPRQVHRMVVAETMVVAFVAALGGLALGHVAGRWLFDATVDHGAIAAELTFRSGILPLAGAALAPLVATWIAAGVAARRAARTRPIQALAEAAIPPVTVGPVRRLLAAVFAAGTLGTAVTTMFMGPEAATAIGGSAVLTGAIAVALVAPPVLNRLAGWLAVPIGWLGGRFGVLAAANVRARAAQLAAVLVPLTLSVSIALGNVYSETTYEHAARAGYVDQFVADAVVTSSAGGITPDLLRQVRSTPGVSAASALVTSRGWIEEPYDGMGTDPSTLVGADPAVLRGSFGDFTGDVVAVPRRTADRLGIERGDRVKIRLGDGARVTVSVVALLDNRSDFAGMVLPVDLLAPHTTAGLPTEILVRVHSGQAVEAALRARIAAWPGATSLGANVTEGLNIQAWINYLVALLALAYAAIAAVNTLGVAVLGRRQELAAQRLAGATPRQVRRMMVLEATMLAAISLGIGTVLAAFAVVPLAVAVGSWLPSGPVGIWLAVGGAVVAIVLPVTTIVTRAATRRRPIDVIAL